MMRVTVFPDRGCPGFRIVVVLGDAVYHGAIQATDAAEAETLARLVRLRLTHLERPGGAPIPVGTHATA